MVTNSRSGFVEKINPMASTITRRAQSLFAGMETNGHNREKSRWVTSPFRTEKTILLPTEMSGMRYRPGTFTTPFDPGQPLK